MKILLYGINFAPELTGIGKYTGELAVLLVAPKCPVPGATRPFASPNCRGRPKVAHRDPSWKDVGVDLAGALVGVVLARVGMFSSLE